MPPSSTPLISCQALAKSFGSKQLFANLSFTLFEGSRIGLVGTNGVGKTTLLRCLAGEESVDEGEIISQRGLLLSYVPQHPRATSNTIWDEVFPLAEKYSHRLEKDPATWTSIILSQFGFTESVGGDPTTRLVSELSGGWQKKLDILKAYAIRPDIILFDEPTNHLDMESIVWLEGFLRRSVTQYLVVSHDRSFLDAISDDIIEINPRFEKGHLYVEGSYSSYIRRREELIEAMRQRSRGLSSKVRVESEWLSRGPKARTTKAEARVKNALMNIEALQDLESRLKEKQLDIRFQEREIETRRLITVKNLHYSIESSSSTFFHGLDLMLTPRIRLGVVGPNGCGKTTLLKVLAGQIAPTQGTIKYAPGIRIAYFDQSRRQIPDHWTIEYALGHGREYVDFAGNSIHVRGWAKRFLFDPDRLELPVAKLSGGERARLSIARLVTEPADVLLLDEPTNDLDIDTLEVLEGCLKEFQGATVLVCHDRTFLRNIATDILAVALTAKTENVFYSDIDQWQRALKQIQEKESSGKETKKAAEAKPSPPEPKRVKLSYKEERELETITHKIEELELQSQSLHEEMNQLLASNPQANVSMLCQNIAQVEQEIALLWSRWEVLESKR